MTLLRWSRRMPRAKTIRPAERYLAAGAEEARMRGDNYVGTEHILSFLTRNADSHATGLLSRLGVEGAAVEQALATLGIDFDTVRERLDESFGPGALERTRSGCLGICPRLKLALAHALDHAAGSALGDQHVLLGILSVPDCVAARVLAQLGVTRETMQAAVDAEP